MSWGSAANAAAAFGNLGGVAGSIIEGRGGSGTSDWMRQLAERSAAFGSRFEPMAFRNLQMPSKYYRGILSGDRTKMMQAIAPEVRNVTDLYQSGLQERQLAGRGGGTSQFYANLPFQARRSIMDIYQTARPMAAQGLTQLGSIASQNVLGGYGQGMQGAGSLMNYDLQRWNQQYQSGQGIGGALFELLRMLKGFGGGGGSTGVTRLPDFTPRPEDRPGGP